jgi:hypothetical protein
MSHVHCPACRYAFRTSVSPSCPRCAPAAVPVSQPEPPRPLDALAEVDAALDRLAVALGRLADDELDAVAMRLVSTEHANTWAGVIAGAIAGAVLARREPAPIAIELEAPELPAEAPVTDRERALFALVLALLTRLAAATRDAATRLRRR